jgi:acetyltransferase-like isoleucine patch superfamily enzyme
MKFVTMQFQDGIRIGQAVGFGSGVCLSATDGGIITIGNRVYIGPHSRIVAQPGAVHIGDDVFIGDGVVIVSQEEIRIGSGTQIAEYVVIRDQDHRFSTGRVLGTGFERTPILVGENCWLGSKVTVLRGSRIGSGTVIGAHSLVRGEIPPHSVALGSPARVVKVTQGA